ncbi:hypothetical protein OOK36_02705 [Streptomyces sp. NBC_00365]|jgi:hypothetical protein|uniref:hypothetical protein n=1 Tax=Streptomyces sp. NBC_00365 TaxID=2975726 RepID=UPI00225954C5|nr:hypothetical protein [Streptomyces sp. NBC_00365]MCX5087822.1 hypothetical protein [Streptomyces sp. NBC_00365]
MESQQGGPARVGGHDPDSPTPLTLVHTLHRRLHPIHVPAQPPELAPVDITLTRPVAER